MSGAMRLLATEQVKRTSPARNRLAGSMGRESVRCSGSAEDPLVEPKITCRNAMLSNEAAEDSGGEFALELVADDGCGSKNPRFKSKRGTLSGADPHGDGDAMWRIIDRLWQVRKRNLPKKKTALVPRPSSAGRQAATP